MSTGMMYRSKHMNSFIKDLGLKFELADLSKPLFEVDGEFIDRIEYMKLKTGHNFELFLGMELIPALKKYKELYLKMMNEYLFPKQEHAKDFSTKFGDFLDLKEL